MHIFIPFFTWQVVQYSGQIFQASAATWGEVAYLIKAICSSLIMQKKINKNRLIFAKNTILQVQCICFKNMTSCNEPGIHKDYIAQT